MKSASLGFSSLLKVDRVISRVLLSWLGSFSVKPMPRIRAACTAAAMNSVKPSRSAGRTPGLAEIGGRVAAFIALQVGSECAQSAGFALQVASDELKAVSWIIKAA